MGKSQILSLELERKLISDAKNGNQKAFEMLIIAHKSRAENKVWHMIYRGYNVRGHEVEDILQEAFLSAWRSLKNFRGDARFNTWLYTNVERKVIDQSNRNNRTRATSLDDDSTGGPKFEITDPAESQIDEVQRKEFVDLIDQAIERLPPILHDVFSLRWYSGLSYADIAKTVGISPQTVKTRIHRARKEVRGSLGNWLKIQPSKK